MEVLNSIFYFVIVIGILVVIHEFGHFIAARMMKMRVETFSIGMGFRLLGWNKKNGFSFGALAEDFDGEGHTDYRLSLFPIGGYVKISGMVDESFDTKFAGTEPQPYEFRAKGSFAKAFAISAGVLMNVLLAVFLFSLITFTEGETLRGTTTVGYVEKNSVSERIGFKTGDRILTVNNKKSESWEEALEAMTLNDMGSLKVIKINRNSIDTVLNADGGELIKALSSEKSLGLSNENSLVFFEAVETLMPAGKAGMKEGDTLVSINGIPVASTYQMVEIVRNNKQIPLFFIWKHGSELKSDSITPTRDGLIGVGLSQVYTGSLIHRSFSLTGSIEKGINETYRSVELFYSSMVQIFRGTIQAKQALGGPIMIAKRASQQAEMGLIYFLHFMGLLSMSLAIINILPFPALDGGHLLFIIIEGIFRKEIPVKVKMAFQQVGIALLLILMAFVVYNDIVR